MVVAVVVVVAHLHIAHLHIVYRQPYLPGMLETQSRGFLILGVNKSRLTKFQPSSTPPSPLNVFEHPRRIVQCSN